MLFKLYLVINLKYFISYKVMPRKVSKKKLSKKKISKKKKKN